MPEARQKGHPGPQAADGVALVVEAEAASVEAEVVEAALVAAEAVDPAATGVTSPPQYQTDNTKARKASVDKTGAFLFLPTHVVNWS